MYKLYTIPGSCSTAVTALLCKLEADTQIIKRDDVENYQKLVPTNQVPAIETEYGLLTEGAAIVYYLLEEHENSMLPQDRETRTRFDKWLMFTYATLHPAYAKLFAVAFSGIEVDKGLEKLMKQLATKIGDLLQILDEQLKTNRFVLGSKPTVIDYLVTVFTSWNNYFPGLDISIGENLRRMISEVEQLPEFQKAYEMEEHQYKAA